MYERNIFGNSGPTKAQFAKEMFSSVVSSQDEAHSPFLLLAETVPSIIWTASHDGRINYLNRRWTQYTGLTLVETQGIGYQKIIHPDDLQKNLDTLNHAFTVGKPFRDFQRLKRFDGEYRWHVVEGHPALDENNIVIGWIGCTTDIHEERMQQEKLREERELIYQAFINAPVVISIYRGPDLVVEYVNRLFEKIVGTSRQVIGLPLQKALPDLDPTLVDIHKQVFATGTPHSEEELHIILDYENKGVPSEKIWNVIYQPIFNSKGEVDGVLTCAYEVTQQVVATNELVKNIAVLEDERQIRENFVATLTHDLRNPLTAAKMSAQMLSKKAHDEALVHRLGMRIHDNLERADLMIRDLLDVGRIKAGEKLPLQFEDFCLNELVTDSLTHLSTIHGDRFTLVATEDIDGHWSASGITRIVENLCDNAVKYGEPNSKIEVTLERDEKLVYISVHNRGVPISTTDQLKLFNEYSRSRSAESGIQRGWGLGLSLVKGIAEAHGGSVSVKSEKELGTVFKVTMPLHRQQK